MTRKSWTKTEPLPGWQLHFTECPGGPCPSVYHDAQGNVVVQGFKVTALEREGLRVPSHEDAVRIPREFFEKLCKKSES